MKRTSLSLSIALLCLVASACQKDVIPDRLEGRVDRDLRYSDIKSNPEAYRGKLMLAGGKVLSAKRTEEGTRLEVLQIPLSGDLIPTGKDTESKGRFIVLDRNSNQVPDPAVFNDENRRVTVVGEVRGMTTIQIVDDIKQQVPELAIKHITVWDWDHVNRGYGPYAGFAAPSGWKGYSGHYGYPYYW